MHQLHFLVCRSESLESAAFKFHQNVDEIFADSHKFLIGGISNLSETEQKETLDPYARWQLSYLKGHQKGNSLLDVAMELCKNEALNHLENAFYGTLEEQLQSCLHEYKKLKAGHPANTYHFDLLEEQSQYLRSLALINSNMFPNQWDFLKLGITSFNVDLSYEVVSKDEDVFIALLDLIY